MKLFLGYSLMVLLIAATRPPPPATPEAPRATAPFARGDAPAWHLAQRGQGLVLTIGEAFAVAFGPGRWRSTPRGRQLVARSATGEPLVLTIFHVPCSNGNLRVTLAVGSRPAMMGCLLHDGGNRPYPGN